MKVIKILHLGLAVCEGFNPACRERYEVFSTFIIHVDQIPNDAWDAFVN